MHAIFCICAYTYAGNNYYGESEIDIHYQVLHKELIEMLQVHDMQTLLTTLSSLQASEIHNINLYTRDYIEELQGCCSSSLLLMKVFSFSPWYDHSVIRELVTTCDCQDGIQLLDKYACQIDLLQSIKYYGTPHVFSFAKIPSDHTLMAIKCKEIFSSLSLSRVYNMKSEIVKICDLTMYSFTLMGVLDYGSDVFYGFVPNAAVSLIRTRLQQKSSCLHKIGVLEVAIFPGFSIQTGDTCVASLRNYFAFIDNVSLQEINRIHT